MALVDSTWPSENRSIDKQELRGKLEAIPIAESHFSISISKFWGMRLQWFII
jgi:hypothetical protein